MYVCVWKCCKSWVGWLEIKLESHLTGYVKCVKQLTCLSWLCPQYFCVTGCLRFSSTFSLKPQLLIIAQENNRNPEGPKCPCSLSPVRDLSRTAASPLLTPPPAPHPRILHLWSPLQDWSKVREDLKYQLLLSSSFIQHTMLSLSAS